MSLAEAGENDEEHRGTAIRLEFLMQAYWWFALSAWVLAIGLEMFVLYVPLHRRSAVPLIMCATLVYPIWKQAQHLARQARAQGGFFKMDRLDPLPGHTPKVRIPWLRIAIGSCVTLLLATIAGLYI
jgi:hypothetical protein